MILPVEYRNLTRHELRSAVIGMLLGDASIQKHGAHCRLQIAHKVGFREYLGLKGEILRQIPGVSFSIGEYKTTDKRTGVVYPYVQGRTSTHPVFTQVRSRFYKPKKVVTKGILSSLTPLGLALWFMDDGHLQIQYNRSRYVTDIDRSVSERSISARNVVLNTQGFSVQENEMIVKWLKERHSIEARVKLDNRDRKRNRGGSVFMNTTNARKFVDIVRDFVLPVECMQYKVDFKYKTEKDEFLRYNLEYWLNDRATEEAQERVASFGEDFSLF